MHGPASNDVEMASLCETMKKHRKPRTKTNVVLLKAKTASCAEEERLCASVCVCTCVCSCISHPVRPSVLMLWCISTEDQVPEGVNGVQSGFSIYASGGVGFSVPHS